MFSQLKLRGYLVVTITHTHTLLFPHFLDHSVQQLQQTSILSIKSCTNH